MTSTNARVTLEIFTIVTRLIYKILTLRE